MAASARFMPVSIEEQRSAHRATGLLIAFGSSAVFWTGIACVVAVASVLGLTRPL